MMIETFPSNNRKEQLNIISNLLTVTEKSQYINIEHINGNNCFMLYFKKEKNRTRCLDYINNHNKDITDRTFKAMKLKNIRENFKKNTQLHINSSNKEDQRMLVNTTK